MKFLIGALATWRISSLIVRESGPRDVFVHLRTIAQRSDTLAALVACLWCCSMWIAIPVAILALSPAWWLLLPFAFSAAAIGIDKHV